MHTPAPRQTTNAEAPARRCSQNRCPSKFSNIRNHRKTPALESPLNQAADPQACSPLKRRLQQRCFNVNIAKFLWTAFSIEHIRRRFVLQLALDVYQLEVLAICLLNFNIFYHIHGQICVTLCSTTEQYLLNNKHFNLLMHNVPKWSDTL